MAVFVWHGVGMRIAEVPSIVWQSIGVEQADVAEVEASSFATGTGAASNEVQLVTARLSDATTRLLVRKTFRPLESGPHAEAARRPNHWAYWRRELTAYETGALPQGPGLRAPMLLGVVEDTLYIEYVGNQQPATEEAALQLGRWHDRDQTDLGRSWLADDQLAQRLATTDLDWSAVEIDERLPAIWDQRRDYLSRLAGLPQVIAHGDFSTGNLHGDETGVVVLDWATLGRSGVGFDLAHLALSTQNDSLLPIYLEGLNKRFDPDDVELGYRIAVSLIGSSRAHWMATWSKPMSVGYTDFVTAHQV